MSNVYIRGSTKTGFGAGLGCVFGVMLGICIICVGGYLLVRQVARREESRRIDEENKAEAAVALVGAWSQVGDARVSIVSATIGDPLVIDFNDNESTLGEKVLIVRIRIENTSATKRVDHFPLSSVDNLFDRTKIVDEHGNSYIRKATVRRPKGAIRFTETMNPGSPPIRDIVCFEQPIAAATTLRLSLDLAAGKHEFRINKNDWLLNRAK